MSLGLKVWLTVWSIFATLMIFKIVYRGFDERFILFQDIHDTFNIIIFSPICCILLVSILFQVLQSIFKRTLITSSVAIATYFIVLIGLLPYSVCACLLLGILATPVGIVHYVLSVAFFGPIKS